MYHEDGTAAKKLLDRLGLPLNTPVIEWQRWGLQVGAPAGAAGPYGTPIRVTVSPWDPATRYRVEVTLAPGFDPAVRWNVGMLILDRETGQPTIYYNYATSTPPDANGVIVRQPVAYRGRPVGVFVYAEVAGNPASVTGYGADRFPQTPHDPGKADGIFGLTDPPASRWYFGQKCAETADTKDEPLPLPYDGAPATAVPGWGTDAARTAALMGYAAFHGRPSALENVGPLTTTVQLARAKLGELLPAAGERFRLALNPTVGTALGVPEADWPRFTGEITDVDATAEGPLSVVQVTGVGRRSRLGRVPVMTSRPAELDGERVRRALFQAATVLPLDLGVFDPGTVTMLPETYTAGSNAAGIVDQVSQDSLGQLVEQRSGRLDWHDANHRRDVESSVTLDGGGHIIKPFRWTQSVGSVVNDAQVNYGPDEARGTVRVTDPESAAVDTGYGPYGVQLETRLAAESDAWALGSTIVGRYAQPSWSLPELTVDVVRSAGSQAGKVLALSHGDKITASGLPPDGAFEAGDLFVEGTTETFTRTAWRVSLAVADPRLAGVGLRWMDVDPELQWNDVDPGLRWLDVGTRSEDLGTPMSDITEATATVSIAAGKAAAALAGFPVRVDLAHMPALWWSVAAAQSSAGLRVRAADGVTLLPFDLVRFDATAKTGNLFVRLPSLPTGGTSFLIDVGAGISNPAPSDPTGRNAVWSDFEAVFIDGLTNRTGKASATLQSGTLGTPTQPNWIAPNASAVIEAHGVAAFTAWSYAISFYRRSTSAGTLIGYSADTAATMEVIYPRSGTTPTFYNSTDSNLIGTAVVADQTRHRAHGLHNGTVDRKLYVDGALVGTDVGAAARPGPSGNTVHLGSANDTPTNWELNYAYLRNGLLAPEWIAAETASWENPAAFYTIT